MYKKNVNKGCSVPPADFNPVGDEFTTLGDKILSAINYGSDLGNTVPVDYDEDDINGVDVLSSPNHDFFDIAEEFGEMIEERAVPVASQDKETE